MSFMNSPTMTFESPEIGSFEHLSALDNLNISSLPVKELPSTTTAPPPLKFVHGGVWEFTGMKGSASATFMLPTAPLDMLLIWRL